MGNSCSGQETHKEPTQQLDEKRRRALDVVLDKGVLENCELPNADDLPDTDNEDELLSIDPSLYQYPFENLVFEGGGNKGLAYVGAIQVLEEMGIRPHIRRIAGTSIGAITATFLAIGFSAADIMKFMHQDLSALSLDHKLGYLSLLPNLICRYGWNPGKKLEKWFGEVIGKQTGDPDITFLDVYRRYNIELCLAVTNLNEHCEHFAHVKTTPHMPIRMAMKASMSLPFLFQAVNFKARGKENIFVDGGLLCNYPIRAFDGWWLSLKPEDSFLQKMQPLDDIPRLMMNNNRFGGHNDKTLGFLLYSEKEHGALRFQLETRRGMKKPTIPDTKLGSKYKKKQGMHCVAKEEYLKNTQAVECFLKCLRKQCLDGVCNDIAQRHLEAVINDEEFKKEYYDVFFEGTSVKKVFDELDFNKDGTINYHTLIQFLEHTGGHIVDRFRGYGVQEIKNIGDFMNAVTHTVLNNVERIFVSEDDADRSVGINTGHVETADFKLEKADVDCIVEQGRHATTTFLKHYVFRNNLHKHHVSRVLISSEN